MCTPRSLSTSVILKILTDTQWSEGIIIGPWVRGCYFYPSANTPVFTKDVGFYRFYQTSRRIKGSGKSQALRILFFRPQFFFSSADSDLVIFSFGDFSFYKFSAPAKFRTSINLRHMHIHRTPTIT